MKSKLLIGCLSALVLFLGIQWGYLWYQGIEGNPWNTVVRTKVVRVLEPSPLKKGEERKTLECVPIQVIVPKERLETKLSPDRSLEELPVEPQSLTDLQQLEYPYLLNRYKLETNLLKGSVLEVYLLEDGSTDIRVAYSQPTLELGRLREVGLWTGAGVGVDRLDLTESLKLTLSYQQDLFRVGPAWFRLRMETSYRADGELEGLVQIGVPIFRF